MKLGQEIQTLCRKIVLPKNFAEFGGTTPPLIYKESAKNPTQKAEIILGVLPPPLIYRKNLPVAFSGGL